MVEESAYLFFLAMLITQSTCLFCQGAGMGHSGPRASSLKYCISMLTVTEDTGEPIAAPWSWWCSFL